MIKLIRGLLITALLFVSSCNPYPAFANLTADQIRELNDATPGTFKVQLGTVISTEQAGIDTNTTNIASNDSDITTLQTDVVTAQNTADTAFSRTNSLTLKFLTTDDTAIGALSGIGYVRKYVKSIDEGLNLLTGDVGQIITFALAFEQGGNFLITPDTSGGWTGLTLSKTGDNATVRWLNSETGWVVLGLHTQDTGGILSGPQSPNFK